MDGHSKHGKSHGHSSHSAEDAALAHKAWEAWQSNDPAAWDWALDQRNHLLRKDPKAWAKAMKEVDDDEAAKERQAINGPKIPKDCPPPPNPSHEDARNRLQDEYLAHRQVPPQQVPQERVSNVPLNAGYAPLAKFAPEAPDSPAYDQAYNNPEDNFHGFDGPLFKIGYTDTGAAVFGVNLGLNSHMSLASVEAHAGLENGGKASFMPDESPIHARTEALVGVNGDGLYADTGAGANFFNIVNGDADFLAQVGKNTGVDGDVRGKVWPVDVQADAGGHVGVDGVNAYTGANTNVADAAGIRAGGRFDLGRDSGAAAGVGLRAGDQAIDFGPAIDTYGNRTIKPQMHLDPVPEDDQTWYPIGDRERDKA